MAYATIPALNQANTKEFNDGADLVALSRTGGPLTEIERGQVLRAVELLRRDNATIFASVRVALPAIYKTGVRIDPTPVSSRRPSPPDQAPRTRTAVSRIEALVMPRQLKVFRTPIGFHDAYVAAPSRKAALQAWGSDADLFARGMAEIVTDPALTAGPLANRSASLPHAW
eukprot:gene46785-63390_t